MCWTEEARAALTHKHLNCAQSPPPCGEGGNYTTLCDHRGRDGWSDLKWSPAGKKKKNTVTPKITDNLQIFKGSSASRPDESQEKDRDVMRPVADLR